MKTIAICNHKGGVGKTALSMAIAEGLHRKGKRTLLVDLDQQMNATQQAKIDTTDEVTVYDLLTSFDYTAKDGIKHFDGGDIIPGDVLVSNAESDMAKLDTRLTMLADAMEGIDDDYDYAIISDCLQGLSEDRYLSELRGAVPSKWNRFLERCLLASVPNGSTP